MHSVSKHKNRNVRVVIAPDSFKGGADALTVAHSMQRGLAGVQGVITAIFPMADGGEGTGEILVRGKNTIRHIISTVDSFGRPHQAEWLQMGSTAIVEAAQGSGYIHPDERPTDGRYTTSLGTGQLIAAAMSTVQITKVIVCLGGSGSSDGGLGLWVGMGGTATGPCGEPIEPMAYNLSRVNHVSKPVGCKTMVALYDVAVPLMGPQGCLRMFGPQKGVPLDCLPTLEMSLAHWADVVETAMTTHVIDLPGAGAAGGMGFVLAALGADLKSGAEYVADSTGLADALKTADLCLTGEGSLDEQSLKGKVVATVSGMAAKYQVPVLAVTGQIKLSPDNEQEFVHQGLSAVIGILDAPYSINQALSETANLVEGAVRRSLGMGFLALMGADPRL